MLCYIIMSEGVGKKVSSVSGPHHAVSSVSAPRIMTRTPNLSASRLFAGPGKKRALHQGLKEPFLSPGGSTHTTEVLEKSKLGVRWLVLLLLLSLIHI